MARWARQVAKANSQGPQQRSIFKGYVNEISLLVIFMFSEPVKLIFVNIIYLCFSISRLWGRKGTWLVPEKGAPSRQRELPPEQRRGLALCQAACSSMPGVAFWRKTTWMGALGTRVAVQGLQRYASARREECCDNQ